MFYIIVCNGLQQSTVAIILNVSLWFSGKCSMFNYINQYISHWCTISKKVRNVHLLMRNQLSVVGSQRQEWSRINISAEPVLISDHSIWRINISTDPVLIPVHSIWRSNISTEPVLIPDHSIWRINISTEPVLIPDHSIWRINISTSGGFTSVQNLFWFLTTQSGGLTSVHLED